MAMEPFFIEVVRLEDRIDGLPGDPNSAPLTTGDDLPPGGPGILDQLEEDGDDLTAGRPKPDLAARGTDPHLCIPDPPRGGQVDESGPDALPGDRPLLHELEQRVVRPDPEQLREFLVRHPGPAAGHEVLDGGLQGAGAREARAL